MLINNLCAPWLQTSLQVYWCPVTVIDTVLFGTSQPTWGNKQLMRCFSDCSCISQVLISTCFLCCVIIALLQSGVSATASSLLSKIIIITTIHSGLKGHLMTYVSAWLLSGVGFVEVENSPFQFRESLLDFCSGFSFPVSLGNTTNGSRAGALRSCGGVSWESLCVGDHQIQGGSPMTFIGRLYTYLFPAVLCFSFSFHSVDCGTSHFRSFAADSLVTALVAAFKLLETPNDLFQY